MARRTELAPLPLHPPPPRTSTSCPKEFVKKDESNTRGILKSRREVGGGPFGRSIGGSGNGGNPLFIPPLVILYNVLLYASKRTLPVIAEIC